MKNFLTSFLLLIFFSCHGQESKNLKYDLAFQRDNETIVLRFFDKKELSFKDSSDPALSPDGSKIAYTKNGSEYDNFNRIIVVTDLQTGSETKLNVTDINYYGASWSPDNSHISFNIMVNGRWQIGLIKSDNTEFSTLQTNSGNGLFSPTWTADAKFIICHDMNTIYKFNLSGQVVDKINIKNTLGESYMMSSGTKFIETSDNKNIIFNCGINESMKGVFGPVEAIFIYNIITKEIQRLTPKGVYAVDLSSFNDSTFLFTGSKEEESLDCIYQVNIKTKKIALKIKNGMRPSMSTK
jgi:TolB protein